MDIYLNFSVCMSFSTERSFGEKDIVSILRELTDSLKEGSVNVSKPDG